MVSAVKQSQQYYSLGEVAKLLSLNVRTVRRMIKPSVDAKGRKRAPIFKAVNISMGAERNIWRVAKEEIDGFIASCSSNSFNASVPRTTKMKAKSKKK